MRLFGALVAAALGLSAGYDFSEARAVLERWIDHGTFPGCVAGVFKSSDGSQLLLESFGRLAANSTTSTSLETVYDLASLTKVTGATTASMALYQKGLLPLSLRIVDVLGSDFGTHGKAEITVEHLLTHSAGFPPDPTPVWYDKCTPCGARDEPPRFECVGTIYGLLMRQTLANPVGEVFVYSDLSFITLMFVLGKIIEEHQLLPVSECGELSGPQAWQCKFQTYVQLLHREMGSMATFLPTVAPKLLEPMAPTIGGEAAGYVNDPNAFALGGVSGHAGFFANVPALQKLVQRLVTAKEDDPLINASTARLFTTVRNASLSTRALGWDTNDPLCGSIPQPTFTHTGYTGTQICAIMADAETPMPFYTILLTNRVWPSDSEQSRKEILTARKEFNSAVTKAITGLGSIEIV